jgi:hypothetical protein
MGLYLNPIAIDFSMQKDSHYVDKTGLLRILNSRIDTENRFLCISRPRRFGKTMAATMIAAYYMKGLNSEAVFSGLDISHDSSYKKCMNNTM